MSPYLIVDSIFQVQVLAVEQNSHSIPEISPALDQEGTTGFHRKVILSSFSSAAEEDISYSPRVLALIPTNDSGLSWASFSRLFGKTKTNKNSLFGVRYYVWRLYLLLTCSIDFGESLIHLINRLTKER